ncbi:MULTISPECIES: hypothetical protein [Streptomyces]|uniref:Vegetative cell wall protein gp1 n=1 Tax=Streptomyces viridochromogenes TaxID=1938 RepID=A0A0L8LF05_STRVR|nr:MULTISPECIES: hypothetical protein [Streptomyces]KOG36689.1 hypothetical protein ADK34_00135 [Streptomyces viridochromogenes]
MSAFLTTLGGRLADAWLSLLVLPGLLYLAVATAGSVLGHRNATDHALLVERIDRFAAGPTAHSPGSVVLIAVLVLVSSAGVSRLAAALGGGVERLWLGDWPAPLRPADRALTRRRARRWTTADARYRRALTARALRVAAATAEPPTPDAPDALLSNALRGTDHDHEGSDDDTVVLNARRNLIALTRPARPTWMGDRLVSVDARVHHAYRLDLTPAWPRLWLLLPDTTHSEIRTARAALTAAARRAGWGALYVLPALWWWPAALVVAVVWASAWRQGRLAVHEFAELVESAVDLHGRDLATALGIPCEERLTAAEGLEITRALRKGV